MAEKSFQILRNRVLALQVCTSLPADEALKAAEAVAPCGTTAGWGLAPDPLENGDRNPVACDDHPTTHKHWVFRA